MTTQIKARDIIHTCKTIASKGNCYAVFADKVNKSVWVREYNSSTGFPDYGVKSIVPILSGGSIQASTLDSTTIRNAYIKGVNQ